MLSRAVIACWIVTAFIGSTLIPTGALAGRGGAPMEGAWNWPPYAGSFGGMAGSGCRHVWVSSHRQKQGSGQWVYRCQ